MIVLDVPAVPIYAEPVVIILILIVLLCLYLIALGIYLIIKHKRNKDKK